MEITEAADALKELGHHTRLKIFKILVKSGHTGMAVGELQKRLDIPNSTLSHHLSKLMLVDLIRQQRDGRTLYCIPQYKCLNLLIDFLKDECCMDQENIE